MKLAWQQIPSTIISEIYSFSDFDGIIIDTEHSPFNNETLFSCIQVIRGYSKKCYIRLAHLDKIVAKMCLDAGCDGLIFSTVESKEQAQEMIDYCRYPVFGGKRGQGLCRENKWGESDLGRHKPDVIAQIETKDGVDNLEEIAKCGFDKYLIGPYDLSASLGCVGDIDDKKCLTYIEKVLYIVGKENLGIHLPKDVDKHYSKYEDYGFVALGMDTTLLIEKIKEISKC